MKRFQYKSQGSAIVTLLGGLVILAAVLFLLVKLALSGYVNESADKDMTETRIKPTGQLAVGAAPAPAAAEEGGEGAAPVAGRGAEVFEQSCKACHAADAPIPFAPKITKKADWAPRIAKGEAALFKSALEGFQGPDGGFMPAKGGNVSLSDDDVKAAVRYMVKQSGG